MLGENKHGRALIIVDMTNEFAHCEGARYIHAAEEIIPFIQGELQYFRERMRPVIFCSPPGSGQIIRELSPRRGEFCLDKEKNNAFLNKKLPSILGEQKAKTLTIVGVQLCSGILLTAADALERGFSVVIPETCVCSDSEQDHSAALRLFNRWSKHMGMKAEII